MFAEAAGGLDPTARGYRAAHHRADQCKLPPVNGLTTLDDDVPGGRFVRAPRVHLVLFKRVGRDGLYASIDPARCPVVFAVPDLDALDLPRLPAAADACLTLEAGELLAPDLPTLVPANAFADTPDAVLHGTVETSGAVHAGAWRGTVRTHGGVVEVLVPDGLLVHGVPAAGDTFGARGLLSGRLLDLHSVAAPRRGLRRLVGL